MRLLVTERILDPGSKKHAWENRDRYFFRTEFSLDDTYRALDPICACRDRIVSAINRAVDKMGIRDTACVFYDVTNYYFEVDEPGGLRQKGVSKEHRKSPIVQMGLLQDSGGIPIGYRLFPGNTPDPCTMLPVLQGMRRDYGCQRVIAVGDQGQQLLDQHRRPGRGRGRLRVLAVHTRREVRRRAEGLGALGGRATPAPATTRAHHLQGEEQAGLQDRDRRGRRRQEDEGRRRRQVRRLLVREVPEEGPQGAPGGDRQGEEAGRQPRRLLGRPRTSAPPST